MDRRRNTGPEVSVRPLDPETKRREEGPLIDEQSYVRADGRFPEQMRPFTFQTGVVTRAAGSSYVEHGQSKVFCSVYGPRSGSSRTPGKTLQTIGNLSCDVKLAPFSGRDRRAHQPGPLEDNLSLTVLQCVAPAIRRDLFPNAYLDIYLVVLEQEGHLEATCVNAANIALLQAGVAMYDSVVAASLVRLSPDVFLVDPSGVEVERMAREGGSMPRLMVAMMPNLNKMTQTHLVGRLETNALSDAIALATDAVRASYDLIIQQITSSAS